MACEDCGTLIGITDIYPDGECGYYYIEGTYPGGASYIGSNYSFIDNGDGTFLIYDIPCGSDDAEITLYNDDDCISANRIVEFNCCGTPCTIQTVEINSHTYDGYRVYSILSENGECDLINGYAVVDSSDPNFTTRWDGIVDDIKNTIAGEDCGVVNECCLFNFLYVSWSNVGDLVTITIENSPVQFSHITFAGLPALPDLYFNHDDC